MLFRPDEQIIKENYKGSILLIILFVSLGVMTLFDLYSSLVIYHANLKMLNILQILFFIGMLAYLIRKFQYPDGQDIELNESTIKQKKVSIDLSQANQIFIPPGTGYSDNYTSMIFYNSIGDQEKYLNTINFTNFNQQIIMKIIESIKHTHPEIQWQIEA